jgi:hypothetical protein
MVTEDYRLAMCRLEVLHTALEGALGKIYLLAAFAAEMGFFEFI